MKLFGLTLILSLVVISCETVIDMDLPEEDQLVINAMFAPDERLQVQVTEALGAMEAEELRPVEDARVILYRNGTRVDTLSRMEEGIPGQIGAADGRYVTGDYKPQPGQTYRIETFVEEHETLRAESYLPEEIPHTEVVDFEPRARELFEREWHELTLRFDAEENSYYSITPYVRMNIEDETLPAESTVDFLTPFPELQHAGGGEFDQIDLEVLLNGEIEFYVDSGEGGRIEMELYPEAVAAEGRFDVDRELIVAVRRIPEGYAEYLRTLREQDRHRDNPFAERVSVYSNVENGLGIFKGYRKDTVKIEM